LYYSNTIINSKHRNPDDPSDRTTGAPTAQRLEPNTTGKTNCLTSVQKDNLVVCLTPKRTEYGKAIRKDYEAGKVEAQRKEVSQLEPRPDGKTNTLTTVQKDNLVMQINPSLESGGKQPYQQNRVYDSEGISPALCANKADLIVRLNERQQKNFVAHDEKTNSLLSTSYKGSQANGMSLTNSGYRIRRLTPTECARLQTIPEWYRWENKETTYILTNDKKKFICEQFAGFKIVNSQSLIKKLNYATNIILDLLEEEIPNLEELLLINKQNVKWTDVIGTTKHQSELALCTINVGKDTELLNYLNVILNHPLNVSFAIKLSEGTVHLECVENTIKCGNYMETLSTSKIKEITRKNVDISEIQMVKSFIEQLQKKNSEENLSKELKLYTILILINLIIIQTISLSLRNQSTQLYINSSIRLQENSLELVLSYIKKDDAKQTSDSAIYRMLGNGWTVEVIKHIFSYLPKQLTSNEQQRQAQQVRTCTL